MRGVGGAGGVRISAVEDESVPSCAKIEFAPETKIATAQAIKAVRRGVSCFVVVIGVGYGRCSCAERYQMFVLVNEPKARVG